jgi:hypothetical protein
MRHTQPERAQTDVVLDLLGQLEERLRVIRMGEVEIVSLGNYSMPPIKAL